jgi:hypothetical protein
LHIFNDNGALALVGRFLGEALGLIIPPILGLFVDCFNFRELVLVFELLMRQTLRNLLLGFSPLLSAKIYFRSVRRSVLQPVRRSDSLKDRL